MTKDCIKKRLNKNEDKNKVIVTDNKTNLIYLIEYGDDLKRLLEDIYDDIEYAYNNLEKDTLQWKLLDYLLKDVDYSELVLLIVWAVFSDRSYKECARIFDVDYHLLRRILVSILKKIRNGLKANK